MDVNNNKQVQRIKVLHLITIFSLGGATENTLLTVEGLQELGYDVRILTGPNISSEGSLFERAQQNNVHVEVIKELKRNIHPIHDVIAFLKIIKAIRKEKYHIIHTHSSKAGLFGRIAAKLVGVPIIVHTIHGLPFHDFQSNLTNWIYVLAEKIGAAVSDKIITVTNSIIEKAVKAKVGRREKFVMVRSGFEMEQFIQQDSDCDKIRQEFRLQKSDLVVGKIARFSNLKGHNYVIDAIPRVVEAAPNAKFLFVGSGELEDVLKEQARQKGVLDHIIFTGLIEQERIPALLSIMNVVVHASLREGLARVLPQALAKGKPVVSFNLDGSPEVIIHGKTGYLVEPENCEQLASAIIDLLKNKKKAEQFGRKGRRLVQNEWTKRAMVNKIDGIYRELLKQKAICPALITHEPACV